jgi:hypothetical protein
MPINTRGFNLSTLPQTNVDFRMNLRPSTLGQSLGSAFAQIGEQKRQAAKEQEVKDRTERISLAALNKGKGIKDWDANLDPADKLAAEKIALDLDYAKQRNEDAAAAASEARFRAERQREQADLASDKAKAVAGIKLDDAGGMMPSRAALDPTISPLALSMAKAERQKMDLDMKAKKLAIETGEKQLETLNAKAGPQINEAYALIKKGNAVEEDFADKPWYGQLQTMVEWAESDDRYQIFNKGKVDWVIDRAQPWLGSQILQSTAEERALRAAGYDDTEIENYYQTLLDLKIKDAQAEDMITVTPVTNTPIELPVEEARVYADFNRKLTSMDKVTTKKSRWIGDTKTMMDRDKLGKARLNFGNLLKDRGVNEAYAMVEELRSNPTKEGMEEFDSAFPEGSNMAAYVLTVYPPAATTEKP